MRTASLWLIMTGSLLSLGLLSACGGQTQTAPPTASEGALTETERSKIDRDLLRLLSDSVMVTDIPSTRRSDGTPAYAVRIDASNLEALRKAGVPMDSTSDSSVWTHLSLEEVFGLARLEAVTAVRADNDPRPR